MKLTCADCDQRGKRQGYAEVPLCDDCYRKRLAVMDPKTWRAQHTGETVRITGPVIEALNAMPGIHVFRNDAGSSHIRGGKQSEPGSADVIGWVTTAAPALSRHPRRAWFIGLETKGSHATTCNCASCKAQREWGARLERDGGIYGLVRSAEQASSYVQQRLNFEMQD